MHTFVSAQSESVVQQFGTFVWLHVPVVVSHVSFVHGSLSWQSAAESQQPGNAVNSHLCVVVSHLSVVQLFPSLHSWSALQHWGRTVNEQVCVDVLQMSAVQAFASSQSAFEPQHPGMGVFTQVPWEPPLLSQMSVVQGSLSLHCPFEVHANPCRMLAVGSRSTSPFVQDSRPVTPISVTARQVANLPVMISSVCPRASCGRIPVRAFALPAVRASRGQSRPLWFGLSCFSRVSPVKRLNKLQGR